MRKLLHLRFITWIIGWIFAHMSFLIPVTRLRETPNLIAFPHPSPAYKFHALIVPKRQVKSLADLDPGDAAFLTDLYAAVQSLVKEFDLKAWRLIVNGGEYQDFPHLHFHLISDL
ncbi:MAG: HIT domain-containing protein [Anaerolineaceae bacterium]|jgi:histidine triad (HIT) family protein|nr:MAG: HIT domain-containing protein [Anaerolineaceae bacterium]